jgi:GxxExxY protein
LRVEVEVPIPVHWDDIVLDIGFRADLIVEDIVIVELKSAERVSKAHSKQLLTYLRVTDKRLGLLINFGAALIKDGITRVANRLAEPPVADSTHPGV